jgi:membrane protein insertase Oxa1/YidC/SpoIIIJ
MNKENSELYKISKTTKDSNTKEDGQNTKEDMALDVSHGQNSYIKKKKKIKANPKSIKYIVFIGTIWVIFAGFLIAGCMVHFKEADNINAASILWTLSFIVFIIGCIYTYLYVKARRAASKEEKIKLLKYLPL